MIGAFAILMVAILKYKPVYRVTVGEEEVGYIANRYEFEKRINENLIEDGDGVVSSEIEGKPEFSLQLVAYNKETNEDEIYHKIESTVKTVYRMYALTLDGETTEYVETLETAEALVEDIKAKYDEEYTSKLGIIEVYTENKESQETEYMLANVTTQDLVREEVEEEEWRQAHTLDGVLFAKRPVAGRISSRFGSKESIRDHVHKGLDIAAPNGTTIYAAADGTVTFAGMNNGGYGNLVTINHGNGIETYYGHCSKIYVTAGQKVTAGEKIAAVGSTGRSTGNHLHFEIRKNGAQINPQKYLY